MAGEIKHKWNGTILTITSDSGTSSCDLKGRQGDDGCRGPQGPAGIVLDADGNTILEGIATEDYVGRKIAEAQLNGDGTAVDLSVFYTKGEVDSIINSLELGGGNVDLTNYYTKGQIEAKGYQTASQVQTAINNALAALDGDGVSY